MGRTVTSGGRREGAQALDDARGELTGCLTRLGPHIAAGSAINFRDLRPETRQAARELAASVVEGLRALAPAA